MTVSLIPVNSSLVPNERPRSARVTIPWGNTGLIPQTIFPINLQQQSQTNQFTACQSIYVDNTTVPYGVQLIENETGQTIFIPPFSSGVYPILASSNPSLTAILTFTRFSYSATQPLIACTTSLFFMNVQLPFYTQQMPQFGTANIWSVSGHIFTAATTGNTVLSNWQPIQIYPTDLPTNAHLGITSFYISGVSSGLYNMPEEFSIQIAEGPATGIAPSAAPMLISQRAYSFPGSVGSNMPDWAFSFNPPYITRSAGNSIFVCTDAVVLEQFVINADFNFAIYVIK